MSAADQPYSDRALDNAEHAESVKRAQHRAFSVAEALDAASDREALGLEASVYARKFLEEIVEKLRSDACYEYLSHSDKLASAVEDATAFLLREFESTGDVADEHFR